MADNTLLNPGTGGDTIATDDIAGVKYQRVKVTFGADGTATDASSANPLPVAVISVPTTAVTGTFFQATQPVSLATNTPTLQAGTNTIGAVLLAPTTLWVTATAATGVAATLTLPAAGVGLFHYITAIDIQLYATAARTGSATPVLVTTTNLPGSPVFNFPTAQAIGAIDRYDVPLMTPLKSSVANTATTVVAPIATAGIWRINVGYYTAA